MTTPGFSRADASGAGNREPCAIMSIDATARTAEAMLRSKYTVTVNTSYAVGEAIVTPAIGEQWYIERFDMEWRLASRIPFNDPALNIEAESGQVLVGSRSGPTELVGPTVKVNNNVLLMGEDTVYRDHAGVLEHRPADSTDDEDWTPVFPGVEIPAVPVQSVAGRTGNVIIVVNDLSDATAYGKGLLALADQAALQAAVGVQAAPYDIYYAHTMQTRGVGPGDNTLGIKMQRAVTFTSVTFRCSTADASGSLTVELRKNGVAVAGTSTVIPFNTQSVPATTTGSWAFATGDVLTVQITGVGSSPGLGLAVDIKGTA